MSVSIKEDPNNTSTLSADSKEKSNEEKVLFVLIVISLH